MQVQDIGLIAGNDAARHFGCRPGQCRETLGIVRPVLAVRPEIGIARPVIEMRRIDGDEIESAGLARDQAAPAPPKRSA